jgi:LacI family transcriptional regulator
MVLIGEDVEDFPSVGPDNRAVGRLAGEHFTHLGLTSWGYCGNPGMEHSEEQFAGLREAAETVGATCSFLAPNVHACIMGFRQDYEALLAWVDSLPAPTGVLTVSTEIAHRLTVIFRNEGIDVPERIALLASGQDVLLSDLSIPRISMVDRGSRRVGYQAAAMLDRLLRGEKPEAHHVDVEPAYVISRASTDVLAVDSPRLARAIRYVRAHATEGLRVSDVIDHAGMSRRGLELGFKRNLGRTVHAEIIRVQVEEARRLLAGSELPIADISARCGFAWGTTLSSVFRRETGMTPNQYRRRYGTAGAR